MATIVRMPEIATGSAEATIATWLVAVGDAVVEGQAIVEIETEKATIEYAAEAEGTLAGLLLEAGESGVVGTPIAVLASAGQTSAGALAEAGAAVPPASLTPAATVATSEAVEFSDNTPTAQPELAVSTKIETLAADEAAVERRFASPLVRKLARERGLDLNGFSGSGPHGRIVRRDLDGLSAAAPLHTSTEATPASTRPVQAASTPRYGLGFEDVPHTGIRRAIARRLTESKSTVPHFYLVAECRVDALLTLRNQINELEGTRVSVNDFVVKAVAGALHDLPEANAIWTDEATRRFDGVDVSIAVSVPAGLLTPVVRNVEKLSLGQLSSTTRDLAERARDGRLKQQELEGGTFSVSNLGMYGISEFSAIINPPQAGILAVGAAEKRPVVTADGDLAVATVMTVTLSADHRVLDGTLAAEWLTAFKRRIENPMSILVN